MWILGISPLERSKRARPETFENCSENSWAATPEATRLELSDELHEAVKLTIYVGRKERGVFPLNESNQF